MSSAANDSKRSIDRGEISVVSPPTKPDKIVAVRIELKEAELQRKVKLAGGKWFPHHKLWQLRYDQVVTLGLEARIEHRKVSNTTNPRKSKSL